jgi:hypothetical protein
VIHVQNHLRANVHCIYPSFFSDVLGQTKAKIPGAGPDICQHLSFLEIQRPKHFVRLLVGVALRVFQHCNIRLRVLVEAMQLFHGVRALLLWDSRNSAQQ